jgi:NET1-associated nuclear protein 1 (U3 small nucleolar RNA-associated protein 17)
MKVLDEGKILVLYAGDRLLLGQRTRKPEEGPADYTWREVSLPHKTTTIDARCHAIATSTKKKRSAVDIVVGSQNGSILIYDDVLFRLVSKERNPRDDDIVSRRFHWHRNEVLTVKWSLDGNYVISGGHETVMVIWQLDTGQQQFLPHLSAAVQHLTVSPTALAYAVHLADNSVVVLSTSELQPTAYISGLSLRHRRANEKKAKKIPAALQPKETTIVELAVPADYPTTTNTDPNATLLQTYDFGTKQQTNRQALVRNNITALNVDPSGKRIKEPDVIHLKISHDGQWLATVDEWTPPKDDLEALHPRMIPLMTERSS